LGALVASTAFVGFAALAALPPAVREQAAILTLLAFRVGYSLLDVPQNTLLAFISTHDVRRTQVASQRYIASGLALLLVTGALTPWVTTVAPQDRAGAFLLFAVVLAPVSVLAAVGLWAVVRGAGAVQAETTNAPEALKPPTADAATGLLLPLLSILLYSGFMPLFKKLEAYFVAYSEDLTATSFFMVAAACGQIVGQFGWMWLATRVDLLRMYRLAAALLVVVALAFAALAGLGGWVAISLAALFGVASTGLLATIWAFLARAAAAAPDRATLRFGQLTFCSKIGQAVGVYALGQILGAVPYTEVESQAVLVWTMALGPFLAGAACSAIGAVLQRRDTR
jgi:Na+/melibiose symporter-like transporter